MGQYPKVERPTPSTGEPSVVESSYDQWTEDLEKPPQGKKSGLSRGEGHESETGKGGE